jgi:exoribonuclease-2
MRHDVVVIQRRDRVALAAVIGESRAADGSGMLSLVAEDGARFSFPSAQALARATDVPPQQAGEEVPQWLARLRAATAKPVDWKALHARADEGAEVGAAAIAALAELPGEAGCVSVALASGDAEPWFRREGAHWVVAARGDAESKLARADAARREHAEDDALRAWWPRRAETKPPGEAAGAVEALREFALRGQTETTERGRHLAAKLDLPEPDHVLEALVDARVLAADVNPAPWRAGLADGFRPRAVAEAARVAASPVDPAGREDLTELAAVAVDDAHTTEVDDAVSVRDTPAGPEVLVHICDVAALVPVGSALDKDAARRSSSLYLPESSIPMLPTDLVARLSLEAGAVREAVTGAFRIDGEGRVVAARFARSLVRITRRLTYEATEDAAALGAGGDAGRRLVEVAERLRAARRAAGAILVALDSLEVDVEGGRPTVSARQRATPGDLVVGELMVLFNREAAGVLAKASAAAFFRTQEAPREPEPGKDDPLRQLRARRRFAPSAVSIEPARHHGVGADQYAQATSPLRRFADLVNQRQLAAVVAGTAAPYRHADLERMVPLLLARERAVRTAADDRVDHWVARTFEGRVGAPVEGTLSRVPRRGLGAVWVPSLCRELPLRPPAAWQAPPEGTTAAWRVSRVAPWRGRVELEPAPGT